MLECRQYPGQKYGESIPALKLEDCLNEFETWMWDFPDADLEETEAKYTALVAAVKDLCQEFFKKRGRSRCRVAELERAAKEVQDEKMANGEDEDHDNRKLKKADEMCLVMKNKEEGTEIFKGGVEDGCC